MQARIAGRMQNRHGSASSAGDRCQTGLDRACRFAKTFERVLL